MNNEVLNNVQISDSIVLAQFKSAKRFKMKPETYAATINAKQKLESLKESEIQKKVEQKESQALITNEEVSNIDKKMVKLDEKNVGLKELSEELYSKTGNRPIRIKQSMITNITGNYTEYRNQNIDTDKIEVSLKDFKKHEMKELLNNPSVMKVDVINKTGYSLEEIQNQQIQELLRNPQKLQEKENETSQVLGYTLEEIQNQQIQELLRNSQKLQEKENETSPVLGYTLEEIQNQQIQELLRNPQKLQEKENETSPVLGYTLEEIQNQQIQELLRNPQKLQEKENETSPILGYTLEEIQNQEIEKLLNKEGIKQKVEPVIPGYTLEEIQNQEIKKMLESNRQIRDEIQIVPDRFIGLKETIDNEFANQENVQQISREEVEETIKAGKNNTEVQANQTPNINKEEMARNIQNSIAKALSKLEEKNEEKQKNKFNFNMPSITFKDIFKSANKQEKENDNMSDYEISESIREQIRTKLKQQKENKHTVAFSNEEQNSINKIDFQSYKDKITQRIRKNNELKELREQLQKNTAEKANKVQLAQARRQEAEAKFEEYLQKLDEQADSYNNEINEYQNQDSQYNDQINLLEEETNMLYGMLGFQE